jgi:adenosylmethionine-8-amino-7-oxononanoate aminotransferase
MSNVIYRAIDEEMSAVVGASGHWLMLNDGRQLLDYSSGPCAYSLGHSNRSIIEAMHRQAQAIPSVFSGFWRSAAAERAADLIAEKFEASNPGWFGGAIFQNAGGEAVDFACKLASQYHLEGGKVCTRFAVRDHAFHGVGLLPFAMSGHYPRYDLIAPYQQPVRSLYTLRIPSTFYLNAIEALRRTRRILQSEGHGLAAIVIEPIGGPPVGALREHVSYIHGLRELCNEFGILLIYDEVLCGAGRCGYLSLAEHYRTWPDILILGKGISSGYQPVSVICISKKVRERIAAGSKSLTWGTTYGAHTMGCAAVVATLEYLQSKNLYEMVQRREEELVGSLNHDLAALPFVDRMEGLGFLCGIRFKDPRTGQPFPPELEFHKRARKQILEEGVVVYSKGQTVFGLHDFIICAPPLEVTRDEMYIAGSKIKKALTCVYDNLKMARGEYNA